MNSLDELIFLDMNPPDLEWYLDGVSLETEDSNYKFASISKLRISYEEIKSSGKNYTCRSEDSKRPFSVVVEITSRGNN